MGGIGSGRPKGSKNKKKKVINFRPGRPIEEPKRTYPAYACKKIRDSRGVRFGYKPKKGACDVAQNDK